MSRIRSIKPEFWSNAQVMECSRDARLLFIGLWNFCDDAGRHPVSLKQIKAILFPCDEISLDTIRGMIDELSTNDLIDLYIIDNKEFLQVTGWKHQKIDKPQDPKYPKKPNDNSPSEKPFVDHSSNVRDGEDRIGKDKIGEEKNILVESLPPTHKKSLNLFELFWDQIPRLPSSSKSDCLALWLKLTYPEQNSAFDGAMAYEQSLKAERVNWPKKSEMQAEKFLLGRRWDGFLEQFKEFDSRLLKKEFANELN